MIVRNYEKAQKDYMELKRNYEFLDKTIEGLKKEILFHNF